MKQSKTYRALEIFIANMTAFVHNQIAWVAEFFVAYITAERFFPAVGQQMFSVAALLSHAFSAMFTFKWLWNNFFF